MAKSTLATRIARLDRERFVGRRGELERLAGLFGDEPSASVVLLHGPGGIGKSTLLRELMRRGELAGWTPWIVEGRDLPPDPDALEDALAGAQEAERPLLVLDTYERMTAIDGYLRQLLLPRMPERTVALIAGRTRPDPAWSHGGWETLTVQVELGAFADAEALELLRAAGVGDDRRARHIAAWAGGSPLALTLAAEAAVADALWDPAAEPAPPEVVEPLIRRIFDADVEGPHAGVMAAAAIGRVITPGLLRDALPGIDAEASFAWLAQRSVAERLGDGVALHELVRKALRADLARSDPEFAQDLRVRIADHLHARAIAGELRLTIDLADLVESPAVRAGYSYQGATRYRIDALRPGDDVVIEQLLARRGMREWWAPTRLFVEQSPERVAVARDAEDRLRGFLVAMTPANAPAFAEQDPLVGPWLRHAREHAAGGAAVLWRDAIDFTRSPIDDPGTSPPALQALLNMAGILRAGLPNPRCAYLPINPSDGLSRAFVEATGAQLVPELRYDAGRYTLDCYVLDFGPQGLLGLQRAVVYAEAGRTLPGPGADGAAAAGSSDTVAAVRDALRDLHVPVRLARSPLATGAGTEERAASVRALVDDAAARAFGDTDDERLQARVLDRGYLHPAASHELAAGELHLSRATYFRRLRRAAERVAEVVASDRG